MAVVLVSVVLFVAPKSRMLTTLLVLMVGRTGTAGRVVANTSNPTAASRTRTRRAKLLRDMMIFTITSPTGIIPQFRSLCRFQRAVHQLYIGVLDHVRLLD